MACRSYLFVCTLHHLIIIIVQTHLKTLKLLNVCQICFVECVSKIEHILLVIHYSIYGAVCFQFTQFPRVGWENILLCLIIIIKSEVWTIIHCLGLGHETMVCAVCLFIFLWNSGYGKLPRNSSDSKFEQHRTNLLMAWYKGTLLQTELNFNLIMDKYPWEKKNGHRDCSPWAHCELTVTKMVTASRDWAVTWAVIELWPSRDWAVIILTMPWLSCDLAVTELWPSHDWAVTSPWLSCDLS